MTNYEIRVKLTTGSEHRVTIAAKNSTAARAIAEAQTGGIVLGIKVVPK